MWEEECQVCFYVCSVARAPAGGKDSSQHFPSALCTSHIQCWCLFVLVSWDRCCFAACGSPELMALLPQFPSAITADLLVTYWRALEIGTEVICLHTRKLSLEGHSNWPTVMPLLVVELASTPGLAIVVLNPHCTYSFLRYLSSLEAWVWLGVATISLV